MTSPTDPSPASGRPPVPWMTVAVALVAVVLHVWLPANRDLFYEREALRAGEWWRLWSGHFVHFGTSHLIWNLAVLVPAGAWSERLAPARARWLLLLAPGFISGVLFALDPALQRYGGLSGVAAAMLAFLAFTQLGRGSPDRWFWRVVLLMLALKIAAEVIAERPVFARFVEAGAYAVPLAHFAGIGAAWFAFSFRRRLRLFSR